MNLPVKFSRITLALASAALLVTAPAARATLFDITSGSVTTGAGYSTAATNTSNGSLYVAFTDTFANGPSPVSFNLDTANPSATYTLGTVTFLENDPTSGGQQKSISSSESTGDLSVNWSFIFTNPLGVTQSVLATGTAMLGPVKDATATSPELMDYAIDWSDVVVAFGNGGSFKISLNDLSFSTYGETHNQEVTFTLLSAPTVAVPEPGSLALLGLGLAGLAGLKRRKNK